MALGLGFTGYDGLNLLAKQKTWPKYFKASGVLTPHPGEMARLLGSTIDEVQSNRLECAREAAKAFGLFGTYGIPVIAAATLEYAEKLARQGRKDEAFDALANEDAAAAESDG